MRVLENGGRNLTPHRAFAEDLENYIKPLHAEGDHFIITGDFNCTLKEGIIQKLMSEYSLTEIMDSTMEETPPTRENGTKKIDHIFISTPLMNAVTRA